MGGMRILVIHEYNLAFGGGERYLHHVCRALRQMGHRVALICAQEWNGGFIPSDQTYGVTRSVGLRTGLGVQGEYDAILQREDPEVVFINGILRHFVSPLILARVIGRRPSVLFVHHSGLICHTARKAIPRTQRCCEWPLGLRCFREGCVRGLDGSAYERLRTAGINMWRLRTLRRCQRVIAPSQFVYGELVRNGYSSKRIRVLPYFTDLPPGPGARIPRRQILWVGRSDGGKGLDRFFQCLAMLRDSDWHAVVVGDDTATPEVRTMAEAAGIAARVECLGRLEADDLDGQYAASRVVAFTSAWAETFGQVGIEAMAFGKPVVAFDVGGVSEWLSDDVTGFLVPRNDVAVMADRLSLLLADDGLCERLGAAGRSAVADRFQPQHHIPKLLEVFREAMAASPGALSARRRARGSALSA